jgi:hypothetical protein
MNLTLRSLLISLTACTLFLGGGLALAGAWQLALLAVILGGGWIRLEFTRHAWVSSLGYLSMLGLTVLAVFSGAPALLILPAATTGLAAWDLSLARRRMQAAQNHPTHAALEKAHLARLVWTLGLGLGLTLVVMPLRVPLGFFTELLLILIVGVAFTQLVLLSRRWRSEENQPKE